MATHRRTPPAPRLAQRSEGVACVPAASSPPHAPLFPSPSLLLTFLVPSQVFSSIVVGPSMVVHPTSIAIGAASIHSIILTVCELELEMWCFPISCESFGPSRSQLLKPPGHIRLHRQPLLLFRHADLPSLLSSYIVQVVIHYFDKQSTGFISSATGAITISYIMQLLTGLLRREFSAVIYATQSISDILSISGGE
uniref:Uncharacterized protein n=1 Tax=Oryza glumipatula TaxID=40148 RepID=A0A0E0AD62_9ORYZ